MNTIKLIFPDTPAFRAAAIEYLMPAHPDSVRALLDEINGGGFITPAEAIAQHAAEHPTTLQGRRAALVAKVTSTGGQSRDAYTLPPGAAVGVVTGVGRPDVLPPAFDASTLDTDIAQAEAGFSPEPTALAVATSAADVLGVDSTGRCWDHRIDSSNQKKNADGTWAVRRNVTPLKRSQVIAELMGTAPSTPAPPPPPQAQATPPPPPPPQAQAVPPPPPPSMFDTTPPAREPWNVGTLIGAAVAAGKIDELTKAAGVHGVVDGHGAANIGLLYARPDLFDVLAGELGL